MDQGDSNWPLVMEARDRYQVSQCEICGGQSGPGTGFSPSISVLPCQYHFTNALIHLHLLVALTETTNMSRLGIFQKAMLFWKSGLI